MNREALIKQIHEKMKSVDEGLIKSPKQNDFEEELVLNCDQSKAEIIDEDDPENLINEQNISPYMREIFHENTKH